MESQSELRYMLTNFNSDPSNRSYGLSSPGAPPSCRYTLQPKDLRDDRCNSAADAATSPYGYNSAADAATSPYGYNSACGSGAQYNRYYSMNGVEASNNHGQTYSPYDGQVVPSTSNNISIRGTFIINSSKKAASNINTSNTSIMQAHSINSPIISNDGIPQTTPSNAFGMPGHSQPPSQCLSLISHSESIKKTNFDPLTSWSTKKAQPHKSAKRNLKYLPVVTCNEWQTHPKNVSSDSMHVTKTDLYSQYKSQSLQPPPSKGSTYPEYSNMIFPCNDNSMQYMSSSTKNGHASHRDRSNETQLDNTNKCLTDVHPVSNSRPVPSSSTEHNHKWPSSVLKCLPPKDNTIKHEKTTADNKENNNKRVFSIENQENLVGPPVRFTCLHADSLTDDSDDFTNLKCTERNQVVCWKCVGHSLANNPQNGKTSHDNKLVEACVIENVSNKYKKPHSQSSSESRTKNCTDSIHVQSDKKANASMKGKNVAEVHTRVDNSIRESQLEEDERCENRTGWLELSIEENGDFNHGSHLCFGCQKPVFDRYVIQVKDHGFWHAECLKCSNCQDNLSGQKSCYVKNEQVFCRNDYNILFGLSCVKCSLQFKREQDWMRVAGQHRYHIACFLCKICKRQLGNNEKYHLVNGTDIYCTNHYRDMVNGESSDGQQPPKKAKRNRTSYTEAQIKFLQDRFLRDSNPDGNELEKIATHINLKKRVVQVWFQNNRARLKKSANNTKGGNQENKNPSMNSGVSGNSGINDAMSIDWDNSLEQSSLDEHTYPNSASPSQMRPDSAHFMDTTYSLTPTFSGPLLCLPAGGSSSTTLAQEPGSLGDGSGSGTSTCGTPREQQISPHFSDMSNIAYQGTENAVAATLAGNDNSVNDLPGAGSSDYSGANNSNGGCGSKGASSPNIILSALRSSVMRDKFSASCQRRMDSRDQQEHDMRNHMMLFQDQPVRHHSHHHPQSYHIDSPYGSHMGIYSTIYNMYTGYGPLNSLTSDQNAELSDSHHSFLRIKSDQTQNSAHQGTDQTFDPHYNSEGHFFNRSHIDMGTSYIPTRPPFGDTNGHANTSGNVGASGNSSPLSFLGASAPNPLLQSRSSAEQCSYLQGHQLSSPPACGQGHNYRSNCASPSSAGRNNPGSYLHSMGRSVENYFVDGETT